MVSNTFSTKSLMAFVSGFASANKDSASAIIIRALSSPTLPLPINEYNKR